jgi:hypothetical protein
LLIGVASRIRVLSRGVCVFCSIIGVVFLEPRIEVSPDAVEISRPIRFCSRRDRSRIARRFTLCWTDRRLSRERCHCVDGSVGKGKRSVTKTMTESILRRDSSSVKVSVVDVEAF